MNLLTEDTIYENLKHIEFPWPSPVVSRGNEIDREIKMGKNYPFKEVIHVHAVDPQAMGQKPITFFQKVVSLCLNPSHLHCDSYPSDVKQRGMDILKSCRGKRIGSYSDNTGLLVVRKQIAKFIQQRDDVPANYEDIFLSNGATESLRIVLYLFSRKTASRPTGVMIPIPQYPLFSNTIVEYGMYQIHYYLNEEAQWSLNVSELRRAINESRMHCEPKVLVVINPGNPSGFTLSKNDMREIIKFAYEENLFIMADEVYQYNVFDPDSEFHSFKKVISEMGPPYNKMQYASFMSGSKGYMGECGARSGYCEIVNLNCGVKEILSKLLGLRIGSNLYGQAIMYCISNPPQPNEPSYELFETEKNIIMNSIKERAQFCYAKLNSVHGLSCNKVLGAMFVYPRIHLTQKAIEEARTRNQTPDEFYSMEMLENCGVCVLPGCLFGQIPGKYYFRLTFMPRMNRLKEIIERIIYFHQSFMEKYKD